MLNAKYEENLIYDEPIQFRSLEFYPARMRQWKKFYSVAGVLLIDKNSPPIATVETIQMSYLEYLFYAHSDESPYLFYLQVLLSFLLSDDEKNNPVIGFGYMDGDEPKKTLFDSGGGNIVTVSNDRVKNPLIFIGEERIDKHDFKEIRKIIVEQNLLKIPNDKIDKRIRDARVKAKELRARVNGSKKQASLEDQMVALFISTGVSLNEIYNLTIRKFIKALERLDNKIHYEIYLSASMSGFVQFKDKSFIKHWLSDLGSNELDELVRYDSIEAKISGGNV